MNYTYIKAPPIIFNAYFMSFTFILFDFLELRYFIHKT